MTTPPDYDRLIDAPTRAFIRATEACYPPDATSLSIPDQRAVYDRMCRHFHAARPQGTQTQDLTIAGVPCRRYGGAGPTILYFHGGGFILGGLDSHDDICAEIAASTGLPVLSVEYRLCPEHPHPAAHEDCLAVAQATGGPILLAGDSAGGALAAAVAAALRDPSRLLGQVLIYPGLGGDRTRGSYVTHRAAPMLTTADVAFYEALRHGGAEPAVPDPTAAPLAATDFSALPPTLAIAVECDPLADDAPAYAAAIRAAGGKAIGRIEPGLVHGCLRARHLSPRASILFTRVTDALTAFAKGDWLG